MTTGHYQRLPIPQVAVCIVIDCFHGDSAILMDFGNSSRSRVTPPHQAKNEEKDRQNNK